MPDALLARGMTSLPTSVSVGVSTNALFSGFTTVSLPLALAHNGASKPEIASFFVVGALAAAGLNMALGSPLRKRGAPVRAFVVCALTSAAGLAVIAMGVSSWPMYPAAVAIAAMTLVYPLYIGIAGASSGRSAARTVGTLRTLYVCGYLAGLGLYSLTVFITAALDAPGSPLLVAIVLAFVMAAVSAIPRPRQTAEAPEDATIADTRTARPAVIGIVTVAAAVLLMRAADSLRLVYLPLYASAAGVSDAMIGGLFAATVIVEIVVLAPLSSFADRLGSRTALVAICLTGATSFAVNVVGSGYVVLFASQTLYAVFAAGFQSIGIVMLGQLTGSGLGGGAGLYTAVVQIGGMVGILAPLLVSGYSAAVFLIALIFCVVASGLLVAGPLWERITSQSR